MSVSQTHKCSLSCVQCRGLTPESEMFPLPLTSKKMSATFNKFGDIFLLLCTLLINILNSVSIDKLLLFPSGMIGIFRQSGVYPASLALPTRCKFTYHVDVDDLHFLHLRLKRRYRYIVFLVPTVS